MRMAASTLSNEMLEYFDRLSDAEQRSVLQLIKTIVDEKDDLEPISIEEYNKELDDAMTRVNAGRYITHEDVMKKHFH